MADLQMKLLRKKIQKRNEKNKERKFQKKSLTQDEETGMCCLQKLLLLLVSSFSEAKPNFRKAKLQLLALHGIIFKL